MARLALRLQVFISSPADVQKERDLVEGVVWRLARQAARHDLALSVYRFEEDAIPAYGRPLDQSNVDLKASELVIAILGQSIGTPSRVGSTETGTLEELRIAEELVQAGHTDDIFLYYRALGSREPAPSIASTIHSIIATRNQTVWPYADPDALATLVQQHVQRWLEDWYGLPEICRHAFEKSDLAHEQEIPLKENRLEQTLRAFDLDELTPVPDELAQHSIAMYQRHGPAAATHQLPRKFADFGPIVHAPPEGELQFAHPELFFLACACGLVHAILRNDPGAVKSKAYVNPVHQHLSALLARSRDLAAATSVLCHWLSRRSGDEILSSTARNFAAYVLGMIEAHSAADQLADSLEKDPGPDVRQYCITSLGKLRSRRHLPLLRNTYRVSRRASERDLIAKAICRIIGVANFAL